jgi:hypothetical protein
MAQAVGLSMNAGPDAPWRRSSIALGFNFSIERRHVTTAFLKSLFLKILPEANLPTLTGQK